eukprot:TRINITY_DN13069_c0_g1_i1.p1 TRINITY_DN13069_c0_g1~~TRINITY_DN13069_c0_g1_i1.p1  ORF type:complete len:281 (+),score=35.85 TRINITY_DN13069_c0_g1_i1:159-1001(+)
MSARLFHSMRGGAIHRVPFRSFPAIQRKTCLGFPVQERGTGGAGGRGSSTRSTTSTEPNSQNGDINVNNLKDQSTSKLLREWHLNDRCVVQIRHGDITKEHVDAITNAANGLLMHGGGVAAAISSKGGQTIQEESDDYITKNGKVPTGGCAVTGGGALPAQYVFHAVGPVWPKGRFLRGDDADRFLLVCKQHLRDCVWSCFEAGDARGISSISMPAISAGVYGFPKQLCANVLLTTAQDYILSPHRDQDAVSSSLRQIRFTDFDKEAVDAFVEELDVLTS